MYSYVENNYDFVDTFQFFQTVFRFFVIQGRSWEKLTNGSRVFYNAMPLKQ